MRLKEKSMMKPKKIIALLSAVVVAAASVTLAGCGSSTGSDGSSSSAKVTFTNVSYDPTRELYATYNEAFSKYWTEKTGQEVEFVQSHGGSGKQALEVANGLNADVVTLALEYDVDAIEDAGLIDSGWIDEFPEDSAPYTSTIVFLVRKGNPKNIQDWDDLVKEGVGVITPNPKTSGGARWNYLAAWAYADQLYNGDETQIKDFMKKLYSNVLVLDSGARGATTSFVENGQGDVLIAWENEAYLSVEDYPDEYEIVTPSISILAQPSVAIVDENVDKNGTRELAEEYLNYLYSDEAQRIEADNYYRPSNQEILQEYSDVFDLNINLVTIDDFGGWDVAQETHFADGGVFDQIYE
jgi:sulfate transport system substrate-binding protein